MERALEDAREDGPLRARVLRELAFTRFLCFGDVAGALECARESLAIANTLDDPVLRVLADSCLAHFEAIAGRPQPDTMARAVEREDERGTPLLSWRPRVLLAKQRRWAGELEETRTLRAPGGSSSENERPYQLYDLALAECAAGNFSLAEELVGKGIEAARDAGDGGAERSLLYPLALVEAWVGHAQEARAAADRQLERAVKLGERLDVIGARRVLSLLALSEGDVQDAVRELTGAARLLRETGIGHPGLYPVLPDAVEALARSGDAAAAAELLERLDRQAASVDSAWALTAAERSRGLLLLTEGKTKAAASLLADAAESFDELEHRPDAARAVLARGQALLRGGRRTRAFDALTEAQKRFADMGARLWAARAEEELERVVTNRSSGQLTVAERRVAALVAQGRKNREIAQELFVTVATVEGHLTRVYAKLGIRSRSELARLVIEGDVLVDEDEGHV
jgi:DNA-binding CsgD family transcriptional regulator